MLDRLDIFDRIMARPGFSNIAPFYKKHKSVLMYLLFGGLTTLLSIGSFALLLPIMDALIANILSWILAVSFAYATNRTWVFFSQEKGKKVLGEMVAFYGGRLATLAFEEAVIYVCVWHLNLPPLPVKIAGQLLVLILNFLISKWIVFKK